METEHDKIQMPVVVPDEEAVMVKVLEFFRTQEEIEALEGELLAIGDVNIPVKHMTVNGVYARQITMPKGTLAIGHAHTEACLNIVTAGSVSVLIDGVVKRVTAPAMFSSPAMDRKIGYVHDDLTWITVHATNLTDIDKIEGELIAKSQTFHRHESLRGEQSTSIANCVRDNFWEDRLDYFAALSELGFTHAQASAQSKNEEDQIEFPSNTGNLVYVGSSQLHGNGIFASFDLLTGDVVGLARITGKRTPLGRYTNHAKKPNCEFVADANGDISLAAIAKIGKGEELTVNYRQAVATTKEADKAQTNLTQ